MKFITILILATFAQSIIAAPTTQYSHGNPTDLEQYMLELINRARLDPTAEGIFLDSLDTWYARDAKQNKPEFFTNLRQEFAGYPKAQPVAFNDLLSQTALLHARDMVDRNYFSHYTPEGLAPWDRAENQGYMNSVAENIDGGGAETADDVVASHFGFLVDHYNISHASSPFGHRLNVLEINHNELGIGIYGARNGGHVVQNFSTAPGRIYIVGVVYSDENSNNFYDPGEGIPDVTVTPATGDYFAITSSSGGYAIPFDSIETIDAGAADIVLQPNSDYFTDVKPVAEAFVANYRANHTDLTTISVTISDGSLTLPITKTVEIIQPTLVKYKIHQTDNIFWPLEFTVGENAKLDFAISTDTNNPTDVTETPEDISNTPTDDVTDTPEDTSNTPIDIVENTTTSGSAIYRFYSSNNNHFFYTINSAEKDWIISEFAPEVWEYEFIGYNAYNEQVDESVPVYRFWSDENQVHFFTINAGEKDWIISSFPENVWRYEGISWYVYQTEKLNTKPIYRFWSDTYQGHLFTASIDEKNSYEANPNWTYENIAFYAPK